ncbi:hypothetical protein GGH95_002295 [Coemansia sp. RSA 1836]|nr:hypothetical protein GGH95_002295 [Coemansia sp. RSA 1836]
MDNNDVSLSEKLLDASDTRSSEQHSPVQPPPSPRRPQMQQRRSLVEVAVKVVFGAIFTFLLVIICTYAGSKTIFDTDSTSKDNTASGEKVLVEPKVRDCRSTGCFSNFECVPVAADFACFIPPCPSTIYECLPNAMLKDPADALFSIQPVSAALLGQDVHKGKGDGGSDKGGDVDNSSTTDLYGEPIQLTEGYYACIQQHSGQRSWRHPTEPCNTCRCNPRGGVSCTKMLCKQPSQPNLASSKEGVGAPSYASRLLTTVMSLVDPEPDASVSGTATPRYTSIVIDIQN